MKLEWLFDGWMNGWMDGGEEEEEEEGGKARNTSGADERKRFPDGSCCGWLLNGSMDCNRWKHPEAF